MKIAVFGTGMVGETIGSKLIELGHAVMMGPRTSDNEKAKAKRGLQSHGYEIIAYATINGHTFGFIKFTKGVKVKFAASTNFPTDHIILRKSATDLQNVFSTLLTLMIFSCAQKVLTLNITRSNKTSLMGKLAEIKTKQTSSSVADFVDNISDEQKRKDSQVILKMMEKAMKAEPKMWGSSMIGFGNVRYKSPATGREVDWFKIGFSPRKANLSLHLINLQRHADALKKLGKHKTGVGCLYIDKLEDVDIKILEKIITAAAK